MRFVTDESVGPTVARWLRSKHDARSIFDEARGADDDIVLQLAVDENRILITNDKDFGEMIYREGRQHKGVILLRLRNERVSNKIDVLERLLNHYADQLENNFVVATEGSVRIIHKA